MRRFILRRENCVVWLVFTIAVVNLGLGFVTAMALAESPFWEGWRPRMPRLQVRIFERKSAIAPQVEQDHHSSGTVAIPEDAPAAAAGSQPIPEGPATEPARIAGVDELPSGWLDQLCAEGILAESFVEGAVQVLRLEVGLYREQLIAAENRGRALAVAADGGGLKLLSDDLRFINQDWLDKQSAAAEMLSMRAGRLGDHEASAQALEQVLLDQAAEIRAIGEELGGLDFRTDADGGKRLLEHVATLIDHAHALRDRMFDLLATLLRAGERIETFGSTCQFDATTGIPNRIGLEAVLAAWWREDSQRSRTLSVALVDIDRFGRLNQRMGTRSGDQAIAAFGRLFLDTIRKDRGYDRLARVGGQSFLIMMGDTGPHEGLTAAERLRQTVEATTFDNQGAEFELTVSCGVVEVGRTDSVTSLLQRAEQTLKFAKKAGRNRCALDEGSGPVTLEPPRFPVKGRVMSLGDE